MLKIKDNVDLKELEKFGFKYDEELNHYYKNCIGTFNKFIVFIEEDIDEFIPDEALNNYKVEHVQRLFFFGKRPFSNLGYFLDLF